MKTHEMLFLAALGLVAAGRPAVAASGGSAASGAQSSAIPTGTSAQAGNAAQIAAKYPEFKNAIEGWNWAHSQLNQLSSWRISEKRKLAPLSEAIRALENKIGYMRANPGDTAPQNLPIYGNQLQALYAQYQAAVEPLNDYYALRQGELAELQKYYKGLRT